MININGKEYRNIQEQVEKNMDDIQDIKETINCRYKHSITLEWESDGEEPDYKILIFELLDESKTPFTLETLYNKIKARGSRLTRIEFAKYEEGNNNNPYGAFLTNVALLYINAQTDKLNASVNFYRLYDSLDTAENVIFEPNGIIDRVE